MCEMAKRYIEDGANFTGLYSQSSEAFSRNMNGLNHCPGIRRWKGIKPFKKTLAEIGGTGKSNLVRDLRNITFSVFDKLNSFI
jgi:hypothetical protein